MRVGKFLAECTSSVFRNNSKPTDVRSASRGWDDFIRLTTTLSTSKGEDYEDAKSDAVDGSNRTRCGRDGKSAYNMLCVGRLLRLVQRLQVRAGSEERGVG
jgi:hypothetical protein